VNPDLSFAPSFDVLGAIVAGLHAGVYSESGLNLLAHIASASKSDPEALHELSLGQAHEEGSIHL
jgi:hypothetical protein